MTNRLFDRSCLSVQRIRTANISQFLKPIYTQPDSITKLLYFRKIINVISYRMSNIRSRYFHSLPVK